MATSVDLGGNTLYVNDVQINNTTPGSLGGISVASVLGVSTESATFTSKSANALAVGPNGATTPIFNVDASTTTAVAGLNVKGATTGGTVAIATIDSGSANNLTINALGTGTIGIGSVSTGVVTITPATTITGVLTNPGGYTSTGGALLYSGTAVPVGGTAGTGLKFSSTSNLGIFFGSSTPASLVAAQGSLYLRTDGSGVSTRLYINTTGASTWTTVTTAA